MIACLAAAVVASAAATAATAEAAELRWSAPPECDRALDVGEQVEDLVGRKLESVAGLDFDVAVTVLSDGNWELLLSTRDASASEPRQRHFVAGSCAAVSDAAAVAIAMTIRGTAPPTREAETLGTGDHGTVDAPSAPPPRPAPPPEPRAPTTTKAPELTVHVGAGGLVDTATLPTTSFGVLATAALRRSNLRLELQGNLLPSSTAEIGEGRRARFDLLAGALLACLDRKVGSFAALGCAGYELGSLSGRGSGVDEPYERSELWQALRLEVGGGAAANDWLRLLLRVGAVVPTTRSEFVLAGVAVHETPSLSLRAGLSVDLTL